MKINFLWPKAETVLVAFRLQEKMENGFLCFLKRGTIFEKHVMKLNSCLDQYHNMDKKFLSSEAEGVLEQNPFMLCLKS